MEAQLAFLLLVHIVVSAPPQNNGFHMVQFGGLAASDTSQNNACFHKQINYSHINNRRLCFHELGRAIQKTVGRLEEP